PAGGGDVHPAAPDPESDGSSRSDGAAVVADGRGAAAAPDGVPEPGGTGASVAATVERSDATGPAPAIGRAAASGGADAERGAGTHRRHDDAGAGGGAERQCQP